MTQLLIFGGTRFFGKKTVEHFLNQGYEVTIATRGRLQDDFGKRVKRIMVDRQDRHHIGWQTIAKTNWDLVFDNICYTKEEAAIALDYLPTVRHYLVTSSLAVYEGEPAFMGFTENQFDPSNYPIEKKNVDYGEGKRQVEAYFIDHASFPVTYLRFPVVLDDDDYTQRLHFYIRRALAEEEIVFRKEAGHFSYIKGSEIPLAIQFIIDNKIYGPVNISSSEPFTTAQFVSNIALATKKELKVIFTEEKEQSPFSHYDVAMDVSYLAQLGYPVTTLASWLPDLTKRLVAEEIASCGETGLSPVSKY